MVNAYVESAFTEISDISVFPNPASDQITIKLNNHFDNLYQIDLVDITGRHVLMLLPETKIEKGNFERSFDISKITSGIYTYRIRSATFNKTGKFFKL